MQWVSSRVDVNAGSMVQATETIKTGDFFLVCVYVLVSIINAKALNQNDSVWLSMRNVKPRKHFSIFRQASKKRPEPFSGVLNALYGLRSVRPYERAFFGERRRKVCDNASPRFKWIYFRGSSLLST